MIQDVARIGHAELLTPKPAESLRVEIRAVVSQCPYSEVARTSYAEGWRTKQPL